MPRWDEHIVNDLSFLQKQGRLRSLDRERLLRFARNDVIDLSTNDYLNLCHDATFQQQLKTAASQYSVSTCSSRLLGGDRELFHLLENEFSLFKKTPASLFFPSGYAANEGVISSLGRIGARFFFDEAIHASMRDGLKLATRTLDRIHSFSHQNLQDLHEKLSKYKNDTRPKFILLESLYSMDGDIADLVTFKSLAEEFQATLIIDEAHAVGAFGKNGEGLVQDADLLRNHITVNTCGKALAVCGALVTAPQYFIDYMINVARSFIYTTAPSLWIAAALREAISQTKTFGDKRQTLKKNFEFLFAELKKQGWNLASPFPSPIIPIVIGDEKKAVELSASLLQKNIYCRAIRPPTVPKNSARLRFSVHAGLSSADLAKICESFYDLKK